MLGESESTKAPVSAENIFQMNNARHYRTKCSAFFIIVLLCGILAGVFAGSYFARTGEICRITLDEKINPNRACFASLLRLPNIGPSRAQAIIKYRHRAGNSRVVFEKAEDLQKIKGIGPKTVEMITPWLYFDRNDMEILENNR